MAERKPVQVTVTGAAGQIGYQLLFRIASGQLLGPDQPVALRLLEIEPAMKALDGVVMELDDCAFPLLADVVATSDLATAFDGTSWALLVGALPRKQGMERRDLLASNGGIFKPQGRAIAAHAAADVRVLVVGNPCNTNCLIARANAPEVPSDRWFAMTRLDQNRAQIQLARRAGVPVSEVSNMAVWGNHSAASAANAAIDSVNGVVGATPEGDWTSLAVVSDGQYGIPEGLVFGYPVRSDGKGSWSVVEGLTLDDFARERVRVTTEELEAERADVKELLG